MDKVDEMDFMDDVDFAALAWRTNRTGLLLLA